MLKLLLFYLLLFSPLITSLLLGPSHRLQVSTFKSADSFIQLSSKLRNSENIDTFEIQRNRQNNFDHGLNSYDNDSITDHDSSTNTTIAFQPLTTFNYIYLLAPIFFIFITSIPNTPLSFYPTIAYASNAIEDIFDPAKFNPVCHFSDLVYNFLKSITSKY